ncbi:transposase [Sinorhizobium meliloti]|uniref:transposase n=1 Tax=Rhizobium meliloti TaxID=382 RepID=UPI00398A0A7A
MSSEKMRKLAKALKRRKAAVFVALMQARRLRAAKAKGFEILPRRWVVERTFAWLGRCRRLAKDFEKSVASAEAWITIAHIRMLTRRLARYGYR